LSGHPGVKDSNFLAEHWEVFGDMVFKHHLDVEGTRWDPLRIFGVVIVADGFTEVFEPDEDVLGRDVGILENCEENLVSDLGLRNGIVANDLANEELGLKMRPMEKIEVRGGVNVR
jgi:hypothetical protein